MLTQSELKELLHYDHDTGAFLWKRRLENKTSNKAFNSRYANGPAGTLYKHPCGLRYLVITINGKIYKAHRIAWVYQYGSINQNKKIDHIDGNPLNNAIKNLRLVSSIENARNARLNIKNKSGITGVHYHKHSGLWRSKLGSGPNVEIKYFNNLFDACCHRIKRQQELGYHTNHGKKNRSRIMNRFIIEGFNAYYAGKKPHHNPYAKDSRKWKDWIIGYESAKEESSD